jgi:hypothetical protein
MSVHSKVKTITLVLATVAGTALLSGSAFAGADEANMWSFMVGRPAAEQSAPAPAYNVPDNARAYYQGDYGQTVRQRHTGHAHRYDIQPQD